MAELAQYAHQIGIRTIGHFSIPELIEAIEQQSETTGILLREAQAADPAGTRPG